MLCNQDTMLLLTQGALMISTMFFVVSQCKVKKRPPAAVKGIAPSRSFPAPGASSTTPVGVAPRAAKSEAPVKTDKTQSSEVEVKTKPGKKLQEIIDGLPATTARNCGAPATVDRTVSKATSAPPTDLRSLVMEISHNRNSKYVQILVSEQNQRVQG
ncbi:hypothetical protein QR680_007342 [Steinernema hermaphroditum]|uniref:Uncharacterized protein n=1 Tax=Steinernema hermaphroditum TaxID=289476 RepID=A0AA39ICX9_9BILA|nr:hypothetical protein QR680_007342 [Steinernema hermaphroditum]